MWHRRDDRPCRRRWRVIWRRDDRGMLRRAGVRLLERHKVLHGGGRRANIAGIGIWHVGGGRGHGTVLVWRVHVVVGTTVGSGHVAGGGIQRLLGDMLLLMVVIAVGVGRRVVLRAATAARRRTTSGGHGTHVVGSTGTPLH